MFSYDAALKGKALVQTLTAAKGCVHFHRRPTHVQFPEQLAAAAERSAVTEVAAGAVGWRRNPQWAAATLAQGVLTPRLVYGTAWKKNRTARLVAHAIRAGFRGVDTACQPRHYNERGVGEGLAELAGDSECGELCRRGELYVQTKFSPPGAHDRDNAPYDLDAPVEEQVRQSWQRSVANLGTAPDGWVMHSPYPELGQTVRAWRAMEAVAEAQHHPPALGMSNMGDLAQFSALFEKAKIKPIVLQNRFTADLGYDAQLRAFLRDRGVHYQSFWTLTGNPRVLQSEAVRKEARALRRTPHQVFLRYLIDRGLTPLIGARNPRHVSQSLQVLSHAPLDPDTMRSFDELLEKEVREARKKR
eukprot:TRINITY_DN16236_c0_g1_i5.p3 TRINITY_DN16236_c0_g1~~TRINITY_DN16236_c0_g1_i5.p3  ORF type:complete len:359 (+),score=94.76 TRINITY_DN16236_c0_g1_i5:398-1474(+)